MVLAVFLQKHWPIDCGFDCKTVLQMVHFTKWFKSSYIKPDLAIQTASTRMGENGTCRGAKGRWKFFQLPAMKEGRDPGGMKKF